MKILLDENLPIELASMLAGFQVSTVLQQGWLGVKNGVLLKLAEEHFDVFVTSDQGLKYQQNLAKRKLSVIVLPTNNIIRLGAVLPKLISTLNLIKTGDYVELTLE